MAKQESHRSEENFSPQCTSDSERSWATPMSQELSMPMQRYPPLSRTLDDTPEQDWAEDCAGAVQRRKAKGYRVGDLVDIWSVKLKMWVADAEVVDAVQERCVTDAEVVDAVQ